ncbi:CHAT domain-containing protein [Novosphingobium sp.]|uniref:CHAT domain-containing protein n=1 Tax=Novosphingobium sp. TaxID=1874826 RepID=UPI003BAA4D87
MAEALANEGLQQSNLGNFDTAARLFGENERAQLSGDGLGQRLLRNYRALDQLNQRRPDTAGMATIAASSEAGVTTGGNYALDGLVRAFTGAGARAVIASHWPVPDDFNATRRLIGGLIAGKAGVSVGDALAGAEAALMDDPQTSHPFYWAAFVVVGDAAKPAVAAATPR